MKNLISFLLLFPCCFTFAMPQNITTTPNSYIPRAYLRGDAGTTELGEADIVAPLWQGTNSNLFAYGQGRYSYAKQAWGKNPWTGSLGFGYRQLVANSVILGAYVLGDYMKTLTNHNLKQVSPGIELLSRTWDFRANGYFPIGKKKWSIAGWADTFGDYSHISFSGHTQYDAWYIFSEEAGIGADAEIGRKLFDMHHVLVKGYVVGYFFNMSEREDVKGLGARVTIQPNTYIELSLNDDYDNYSRNVFTAGLRVSLYDLFNGKSTKLDSNNLNWRLFTPIERNFAEVGFGDDTRITGGPQDGGTPGPGPGPTPPEWNGHTTPEKTNVWFFEPGLFTATKTFNSVSGNGTYEHPYTSSQFNQTTVDEINEEAPNASLYFTGMGARYNAYTENGGTYVPLTLSSGQSMWGRMGDNKGYQKPATGSNRPVFVGALNLQSNTEVDSVRLENNRNLTAFETGITINGASNVILNNDFIGTTTPTVDKNPSYDTGIKIENGASLAISNSNVYAYNDRVWILNQDPLPFVRYKGIGIEIKNGGTISSITNSHFTGDTIASPYNFNNAYGLYVDGTDDCHPVTIGTIKDSTFAINFKGDAVGMDTPSNITIGTISHSTFTDGFNAESTGGSLSINRIDNATFTASSGTSFYARAKTNLTIHEIDNSHFNGATGANIGSSGTTTIDNILDSDFTGTSATGAYLTSAGTLTINSIKNSDFKGYSAGASISAGVSGNITSIDNSTFTGIGSSAPIGMAVSSTGGELTIESISNDHFTATGNGSSGAAHAFSGRMTNNGTLNIISINKSTFSATKGLSNIGFDFSNSNQKSNLDIGTIVDSTFIGDATGVMPPTTGSANNDGFYVRTAGGNINIDDINHSTFTGKGEQATSSGNYQQINAGLGGYIYGGTNLTIGTIENNSSFTGDKAHTAAGINVWVAGSDSDQVNIGTAGGINNTSFSGTNGLINNYGINVIPVSSGTTLTINIGNIAHSGFTATSDTISNQTYYDGINLIGAAISIGNIASSNFSASNASGTSRISTAMNLEADNITMGDITNSTFSAGPGVVLYSYAMDLDAANTIELGAINNSQFSGGTNSLYLISQTLIVNGTNYKTTYANDPARIVALTNYIGLSNLTGNIYIYTTP